MLPHNPMFGELLVWKPLFLLKSFLRGLLTTAASLWDVIPPYRQIEGRLKAKEANAKGVFYLLVEDEILEIDHLTFDELMVGEALRVRSTRARKIITIDRLIP